MDTAYRTSWIRRIRPIGYGVLSTPVGCIGVLGYGVLAHWIRHIGSFDTAYWLFGYGVLYILDTAYSLKLGNGLLIRQSLGYILTNRIIGGIKEIVSENQSTFVPGRHISDKILITQELMHNYHLDRGPPRCAFKVDIQKAYDTVDWRFIGHILKCFGFHPVMIQWIMACITSTSFSISINGDIHGFFKGKRGLRRGDPLFSYLFYFGFGNLDAYSSKDDLFLFARGDVASAVVIMESLNEFQHVLGLIPSIPKSTAFFCNAVNHDKVGILSIIPFFKGELPVKYLGVPLISSRLLNKDCKILVEKARNHIEDWKNKSLSLAGILQLFKSVISAMQVYWASVLVIPKGKAKVAWESICLPKSEGGLGLRSLEVFNLALMTTHIWNIVNIKSLYGCVGSNMCWGWRKILQLREQCTQSLLSHHLSPRDIARAGYNLRTYVSDIVSHGGWNWPSTWLAKAPILVSIPSSVLDYTSQDCMKLQDTNGNFSEFSVRCAWEALRPSSNEVSWFHLVWFSHCIPRHAFHLWLVMRRFGGTVKGVVGKLIFAAASYYVWLERNNRLFKSIRRQPEELCDLIIVTVCLKLLTFKFNNTAKVESLLSLWKMPKGFRIYG
ncbi:putative reverse transcriptase domain, reverse transcriptase zinc-binding domain protein [Tanacetum coccineum]